MSKNKKFNLHPFSSYLILFLFLFQLATFFNAKIGYCWGLHDLVTDRALTNVSLPVGIPVEPLETFLESQGDALAKLFVEYYDWLSTRKSKRFLPIAFDTTHPDRSAFLRAARLNPNTIFYYVDRVMPNEKATEPLISYSKISPYEKIEKHFTFYFKDISGQKTSAKNILRTFSDEPDWWFDGDLWDHPEYGYGKIPYGRANRLNGAAFHTLFSHENWIVHLFAPEITQGMALDRLEMVTRLSRLAFSTGHPYWGFRFAAWGIHYIEDLSQPYHSKAIPFENWLYYLKFIFSLHKDQYKKESTQILSNRHLLYEDFVKNALQDSYLTPTKVSTDLTNALTSNTIELNTTQLESLVKEVTQKSSDQAKVLDESVAIAYGPRMTEDPTYDIDDDPNYDSKAVFEKADPKVIATLVHQTEKNFNLTGAATRALLKICMSK